jgi:benzoyl-CoA reductase/2-hydroxyglutaryl-CoA dehydratase subunit BcrC/BadD/HgdB
VEIKTEVSVDALAIPHRLEVTHAHKDRGGLVAAVLPIHYPRALLRTFDILPIEVWGPPRVDVVYGAAHLQPYVCSIVRNALSFLQTGGLDVADLIIVPHACDSLQGLASILIDFVHPRQPVIPVYLPRGRRESDAIFLADEFRSLYRRLEEITHRSPSNADLMAGIRREEAADELLAQLHERRKDLPLTQIEFYRLIRAREYLPAETFSDLARAMLAPIPGPSPAGAGEGSDSRKNIPILLSGIVPEPMSLFESIAEMGGTVVADDLACCGRRLYPPGTSEDAFLHLAESILGGPPDSTRGHSIQERLDHLMRLCQASGARGVVFYDVKFCEPELFDLPLLRKGLQEVGVPSVTIEVDLNDPLSHQSLTRIEAFLEMMA